MVEGVGKIIEIDSNIASAGMAAGFGGIMGGGGGGSGSSPAIFPAQEPSSGMDSNSATFQALKGLKGKKFPPPPSR